MLAELLGSKLRAKVLGWLFSHSDERYFGRQLEEILNEDSTNISRELARLAKCVFILSLLMVSLSNRRSVEGILSKKYAV